MDDIQAKHHKLNQKELLIISAKIMAMELLAELAIMKFILPPLQSHIAATLLDYLDPILLIAVTTPLIMLIITRPYIRQKNELIQLERDLIARYQKENRDLKSQSQAQIQFSNNKKEEDFSILSADANKEVEGIHLIGTSISPAICFARYIMNFLDVKYEFQATDFFQNGKFIQNWSGALLQVKHLKISDLLVMSRYFSGMKKSELSQKSLIAAIKMDQCLVDIFSDLYHPILNQLSNRFEISGLGDGLISEAESKKDLDRMYARLDQYNLDLKKTNYLLGNKISLADFALLACLDPAELCLIDLNQYEKIVLWRKKLIQSSFYQNCHSSYSRLVISELEKNQVIQNFNISSKKAGERCYES